MTDHVHNQLCARIEELEKEKLELNEQIDVAQQERDALAAQVARLENLNSQPGCYAGVMVWVGDVKVFQTVDRVEMELSRVDVLQRCFDKAAYLIQQAEGGET